MTACPSLTPADVATYAPTPPADRDVAAWRARIAAEALLDLRARATRQASGELKAAMGELDAARDRAASARVTLLGCVEDQREAVVVVEEARAAAR